MIGELIAQRFGIKLGKASVCRLLMQLGIGWRAKSPLGILLAAARAHASGDVSARREILANRCGAVRHARTMRLQELPAAMALISRSPV